MISLNTPLTKDGLRELAATAWSWWSRELIACLPQSWRHRLVAKRPEFLIDIGAREAVLFEAAPDAPKPIGRFALARDLALTDPGSTPPQLPLTARLRLTVCLSPSLVLFRELDLPQSAEQKLREILRLDLDRQTPLSSAGAVFDVVIRSRDEKNGRLQVTLAVAKRGTIDAVRGLCRWLGVEPHAITVGHSQRGAREFNLLDSERRLGGLTVLRSPAFIAGAILASLLVVNIGLAFWREDTRVALLSAELIEARKAAKVTEKLKALLSRTQAETRLLAESQTQTGPLQILQSLTHQFPDDVWLFQFDYSGQSVQIGGYAPSAADLIRLLDQSGEVANPHFKAPVTRAERSQGDRFEIAFDLRPVKPK